MSNDSKKGTKIVSDRRDFLKLAALGTITAGGAVMASSESAKAAQDPSAKSEGYRETEHVREYYKSASF